MIRWIGAMLIIGGCGTLGFAMAAAQRKEEAALRQMIQALDHMQCELQYRLTPLPELCRKAGSETKGCVGQILRKLSDELEHQISPDVSSCMYAAMLSSPDLPRRVHRGFQLLGGSLGSFDVEGQIRGLEAVQDYCRRESDEMASNRDSRLRSYQTLGLCAGAALAILFI